MENLYFTPGPTQLHPAVKGFIQDALKKNICSISHRSQIFRELYVEAVTNIKKLMGIPEEFEVFFLGSATEVMERIIQSCVNLKSFHVVNGAFSRRFFDIACMLKKNAEQAKYNHGADVELGELKVPDDAELICITQNETSTGFWIPPTDFKKLTNTNKDSLLAVDVVSSAPCVALDYAVVDLAFFSVQKCFGLPSGLGVLIASPKSLKRAQDLESKNASPVSFHSLVSLAEYGAKEQTYETPNVLAIYLLGKMAGWMLEYGIEQIRLDMKVKQELLESTISEMDGLSFFVENKRFQSPTVSTLSSQRDLKALRANLAAEGLHVGSGYGDFKDKQIRIANFPSHSLLDFERLLAALKKYSMGLGDG